MKAKNQRIFAITALLLLIAAILIPQLNDQGLWGDEGWSFRFAQGSPREVTLAMLPDRHPPLYFLMLRGWREIAGDEEISLRMLAVFHTLLTGVFIYKVGCELFSKNAAMLALLMFALSDQQGVWAQEVRQYPLLMLCMMASSYALLRWINPYPLPLSPFTGKGEKSLPVYGEGFRVGWTILYFCAALCGLYTHSFMLIVLAIHFIYALIHLRSKITKLIMVDILIGLAFAPWSLVFVYQFMNQGGLRHDLPLNEETARLLATGFLGKPLAITGGLVLLGVISIFLKIPSRKYILLPVMSIFLPIGLIIWLTLNSENTRLLTDRNLAIILPWLMLLMGQGLTIFERYGRTALILMLLVNGLWTTDAYHQKPPWRDISEYIALHQVENQPAFIDVGGDDAALDYHVQEAVGAPVVSIYQLQQAGNDDIFTNLRYAQLPGVEGLWYVVWRSGGGYENALEGWGYTRTVSKRFYHGDSPIDVYRFDANTVKDHTLTIFDGKLRLHKIYQIESNGKLYVSLWWTAAQPLDRDYTISVFLLNQDGILVSQHDGFPSEIPTSTLAPDHLIFDQHILPLPAGEYRLAVKVYWWQDQSILLTETGAEFFISE